jgi:hypothetical protein
MKHASKAGIRRIPPSGHDPAYELNTISAFLSTKQNEGM